MLVQSGSKRTAADSPSALNVSANKRPSVNELGSDDLEARVVALEGDNAAVLGRVNNLEKDMRHNEVHVFHIPIILGMSLYDVIFVCLRRLCHFLRGRLLNKSRKLVRAAPSTCII